MSPPVDIESQRDIQHVSAKHQLFPTAKRVLIAPVVILATLLVAACHEVDVPDEQRAHVVVVESDGDTLAVRKVGDVSAGLVDTSGLAVSEHCARGIRWESVTNLRERLLREGCAILEADDAPASEVEAEAEGRAEERGHWSPALGARIERTINSVGRWLSAHSELLLAILGVPLLGWLAQQLYRHWLSRRVHIVISGVSAVGKSGLWEAWQRGKTNPGHSSPSVRVADSGDKLRPVPHGRYTLVPKVVDTPGSQPGSISDQLRRAPWRSKRMLVIVLAPSVAFSREDGAWDELFVAEQKGYLNLPRSLLQKQRPVVERVARSERVDFVVMFMTKFDLLSAVPASDSTAGAAVREVEQHFGEHREMIEEACRSGKVAFRWLVGSAAYGWSIQELREAVAEVIG